MNAYNTEGEITTIEKSLVSGSLNLGGRCSCRSLFSSGSAALAPPELSHFLFLSVTPLAGTHQQLLGAVVAAVGELGRTSRVPLPIVGSAALITASRERGNQQRFKRKCAWPDGNSLAREVNDLDPPRGRPPCQRLIPRSRSR